MFHVASKDGVKIAVYDFNPKGQETVFMVHGWPLSHKIFEYQVEFLTANGYRVVLIDLRGFGNSDAPADGYSYDQMADDIYAVVRALRLRSFILAGFSMGGAIVLRYMARHRGYGVTKLALLAAAAPSFVQRPGFPFGNPRFMVDQLISQALKDRPKMCADFGKMLFFSPHSEEVENWFYDVSLSASGIGTVQTAISLRDEDDRQDMKYVRVPTGIFQGEKDEVVPFELAEQLHKGIAGSTLFPFAESGHGIFYDELDSFNQRFLEFIRKEGKPHRKG